ncbi:hypothetical protein KP004_03870 [Geomonas oryzisoli]|uniref:DUF5658 domain-containing protein n=1 Tax=Geomonas oryzisoli TaxID=2847992 RepID=A0ABX8J912_9BACT|nr:hypothetical protein [Geomonas oryzisoli]QWV94333.1 hypothetical protein KP004_03870 [Geomonas oryzisoli]
MELLTYVFVANIFLTFIDATIGYYAAPAIAALAGSDQEEAEGSVRGIRSLLSFVVALYMFFNCLAFFDRTPWLLYLTTAVLVVDVTAQLVIIRKVTGARGR